MADNDQYRLLIPLSVHHYTYKYYYTAFMITCFFVVNCDDFSKIWNLAQMILAQVTFNLISIH